MLTVVTGPPCGGKTTYVEEQRQPGDLVLDLDALAHSMGYPSTQVEWGDQHPAIQAARMARAHVLMLHDAPTVVRWLTGNLAQHGAAIDENGKVHGGGDGSPAPLSAAVLDVRDLLADGLAEWVDDLCEAYTLTGPGRHSVAADAKFLRTWLTTVERLEWVGDWWEWLAERFIDAHALAPWRPPVRRVPGVPCPGCGETNLVIFGGESDITCGSCRIMMTEERFGLWERVLRMEATA